MATITLRGNEIHTNDNLPEMGSQAPDFQLVGGDLGKVSLANYEGKKKLLSIAPNFDSLICQLSTKKFNDHAKKVTMPIF